MIALSESLMDRVRAEAEAAEAEEETPEPEPEPEPELEPEPEPPSDEAMEKLYRAVESKAANYSKAQSKALAETGLPWQPCPCCGVAGFVLPFNGADPDEQMRRMTVLDYFDASEPEWREAEDTEECPKCGGLGEVLSHSRRPDRRLKTCAYCNANGYVVKTDPALAVASATYNASAPPPPAPSNGGEPHVPDVFGRPYGHRDYNVPPAMVNA